MDVAGNKVVGWLEEVMPYLRRFCLDKFGPVELDDLLQEVALSAFINRESFDDENKIFNFRSWCRTVATNKAIDRMRLRRREAEGLVNYARFLWTSSRESDAAEKLPAVMEAIGRLPHRQKNVLTLAMTGESSRSIARKEGIEPSTVRSILRHARNRLVDELLD